MVAFLSFTDSQVAVDNRNDWINRGFAVDPLNYDTGIEMFYFGVYKRV